ncbi:MAG: hypothetical protein HYY21_11090 [Candidatus Tectomicrobia bacterium]|nr:hypothetical protein [Candidatus Tectomicrobia bacterium]
MPVKWEEVRATNIRLFYPGQASWEWLSSPQKGFTHPGAPVIKAGVACRTCHVKGGAGPDEEKLGNKLVPKGPAEDNPIAGKRPVIDLAVKAAYDAQYMYFWLQWESEEPGVYHDVMRFDGKKWVGYGGNKPDKAPGLYEDRLTLLLGYKQGSPGYVTADNGVNSGFQTSGCFMTCHSSMRAMPYDAIKNKKGVQEVFPKETDIRKYILITRKPGQAGDPKALKGVTEDEGRWALLKSKEDLAAMRKKGQFLDMWMWRSARSGHIGYADDIWVFDYRNSDKGRGPWQRQQPKDLNANPPKGFMFNPQAVPSGRLGGGKYAIQGGSNPVEVLKRQETVPFITSLAKGAVKYDPKVYKPKAGDLLFQRVLHPPTESRGDLQAYGVYSKKPGEKMGKWTLILKRKLDTGHPQDDVILKDGEVYPIGFAVHDDHVSNRRHHVSFEYTLGLGVKADVEAKKVK